MLPASLLSLVICLALIVITHARVESASYEAQSVSWQSASDMCISRGLRLCRHTELCPWGAYKSPIFGEPDGDHWLPIDDTNNGWVSIGTTYPTRLCGTHEACCHEKPSWGTLVQSHPLICCSNAAPDNIPSQPPSSAASSPPPAAPTATSSVSRSTIPSTIVNDRYQQLQVSWDQASDHCAASQQRLCNQTEVCQNGQPVFGQPSGDQWMPVGDEWNNWVSVGTTYQDRLCGTHQHCCTEKPSWGVRTQPHPVLCCARSAEEQVTAQASRQQEVVVSFDVNGVPLLAAPDMQASYQYGGSQIAASNPHETVFQAFQKSEIFEELNLQNVGRQVTSGKPFAIFLLCRCSRDDDWNIPAIEDELIQRGIEGAMMYMYAQPASIAQFTMLQTYGLEQQGAPALVIDNIPIGQHVAKYRFPYALTRGSPYVSAKKFGDWFADFLLEPTPLRMMVRSQPIPTPSHAWTDRGMVWEVVGDSFGDIILDSPYHVLLLVYKPECSGCIQAKPVFQSVAATLVGESNVIVAQMDRTRNDFPMVVMFDKYPTVLLFKAGDKLNPINYNKDWLHEDPNSCSIGITDHDVLAFVRHHTSFAALASSASSDGVPSSSEHAFDAAS